MDYYRNKTAAYRFIDELYAKKLNTDLILYKVQTQFGFSEKFVLTRINLLERVLEKNEWIFEWE